MDKKDVAIAGLFFILVIAFAIIGWPPPNDSKLEAERECHTFFVGTSSPILPDTVYIGEIELCGENFDWGNIHGPINRNRGSSTLLQ